MNINDWSTYPPLTYPNKPMVNLRCHMLFDGFISQQNSSPKRSIRASSKGGGKLPSGKGVKPKPAQAPSEPTVPEATTGSVRSDRPKKLVLFYKSDFDEMFSEWTKKAVATVLAQPGGLIGYNQESFKQWVHTTTSWIISRPLIRSAFSGQCTGH